MTTSNGQGLTGSVSFTWTISIPADAGPAGAARLDLGGKCLNDVGNSSANGTQADIWTCNGSSAQQWTYVQDGTLRIHAKCLTVPSGAASGSKVRLESCADSGRQQWRLVYPRSVKPTAGGVAITLFSLTSGMCMTDLAPARPGRWGPACERGIEPVPGRPRRHHGQRRAAADPYLHNRRPGNGLALS